MDMSNLLKKTNVKWLILAKFEERKRESSTMQIGNYGSGHQRNKEKLC